jgi:hypothetical protein
MHNIKGDKNAYTILVGKPEDCYEDLGTDGMKILKQILVKQGGYGLDSCAHNKGQW